ncbi:K+-transporting ATPase, C subunit [Acinetobacter nectaris CIP 110549]|uniref:Potassium-transporting ATPase KdpC subunit n=1 Tax=Acinetobacter nectaris CIP 110549 TaxID=1392540 RepID=V2TD45_9GAMM|nr:potassium-transporting ATPase subunit KdpC [Acinetobacter nectaris]ESK40593.1 K+-transporting ATPase, C subunit [Acinetobacter nectaris CIP 110549]
MNTHDMALISEEKQPVIRQSLGLMVLGFIGTGLIYCILQTSIAQVIFPSQANGSVIQQQGKAVGSLLVAQDFHSPRYFQARPSAINYDPMAMGGSNLAVSNPDLRKNISERRKQFAKFNDVDLQHVPLDMLTASGSGIDPDISPESAEQQVSRVAQERHISVDEIQKTVNAYTQEKQFGFLGMPRVNVLQLNLALDALQHTR